MGIEKIGSQYWVVRYGTDGALAILDGPYMEKYHAVSMARLRDV